MREYESKSGEALKILLLYPNLTLKLKITTVLCILLKLMEADELFIMLSFLSLCDIALE